MTHRYKRYSHEQLRAEEEFLRKKMQEAEHLGRRFHVAVNKRKIEIVQSYMLNPTDFKQGDIRALNGEPDSLFKIEEVNGVIAWGHRLGRLTNDVRVNREREAVLIALLGRKVKDQI